MFYVTGLPRKPVCAVSDRAVLRDVSRTDAKAKRKEHATKTKTVRDSRRHDGQREKYGRSGACSPPRMGFF